MNTIASTIMSEAANLVWGSKECNRAFKKFKSEHLETDRGNAVALHKQCEAVFRQNWDRGGDAAESATLQYLNQEAAINASIRQMRVNNPTAVPTRIKEPTPGPYIVVQGTVIGSLAPVPYDWDISSWYDHYQNDGPDSRFVAETATDTQEGRDNADLIVAALNAFYRQQNLASRADECGAELNTGDSGMVEAAFKAGHRAGAQFAYGPDSAIVVRSCNRAWESHRALLQATTKQGGEG